jgi:hypothetical protein
MAALSSVYDTFPLDISKDEIRVLHLFPKNVSKASGEKDQRLISEVPIREGLVGVTGAEISTNSLESSSQGDAMAKPENNEPQERYAYIIPPYGDLRINLSYHQRRRFSRWLVRKAQRQVCRRSRVSIYPRIRQGYYGKDQSIRLQLETSGTPELAESILATLNYRLKDMKSTLNPNEDTSSALCGTLEVVPLQGNSNYIALSYVWGDGRQKLPFILNGHKVEITENLANALQNLQSLDEVVHLWVDAVGPPYRR